MTREDLTKLVESKEAKRVVLKNGKELRLFVSSYGLLCYFKKGSSRRGYFLEDETIELISSVKVKKDVSEEQADKSLYNKTVGKYKKMASQATFKSGYIDSCLALPTYEEWIQGGKKSLYYLGGVSEGACNEGKVISIDRIAKYYPDEAEKLRECIREQKEGRILYREKFDGLELSINAYVCESGDFRCSLDLEYKNCVNGYYYVLINDNNFIGYTKD